MANLVAYQAGPPFPTGSPLSAIDLEILRNNSIILYKVAANTSVPVLAFGGGNDIRSDKIYFNKSDSWLYHGGFRYFSGMTHLRLEGLVVVANANGGWTDTLKFYIGNTMDDNDPAKPTDDSMTVAANLRDTKVLNAGSNTIGYDIPISGLGFQDGDIIQVTITCTQARGGSSQPDYLKRSRYELYCFAYPVALAGWPGVPTFSGTNALTTANLEQLSSASEWIANYLSMISFQPATATLYGYLSFGRSATSSNPAHWTYPDQSMWSGTAVGANNHTKFELGGRVSVKDAQERYRLYKNGSGTPVDEWPSSSTWSEQKKTQDWVVDATLSNAEAAGFRMGNWLSNTTYGDDSGGYNDDPADKSKGRSRHHINYAHMVPASPLSEPGNGGYASITTENLSKESIQYNALKSRLNAIAYRLSLTKTLIDNNPLVFQRSYIVRPGFHTRTEDWGFLFKTNLMRFEKRRGARLFVRGKGVSVLYGPITVDATKEEFDYKFQYEKEIIPGDKMMSTYIYLDTMDGLFMGMPYYVRGNILYYAAETLR